MATLTVEGKQFDMNDLSDDAKAFANSVSFCDSKINQLEAELAMVRMARNGYVQRLVSALPQESKSETKKATTRKRSSSSATKTASDKPATRKRTTTAAKPATTRKRTTKSKVDEEKAVD